MRPQCSFDRGPPFGCSFAQVPYTNRTCAGNSGVKGFIFIFLFTSSGPFFGRKVEREKSGSDLHGRGEPGARIIISEQKDRTELL